MWENYDEPILNNEEIESYRFSILVNLYDYFKIYRVEKNKNQYLLHVKEYVVATTSERADSLVSSFSRNISESEWAKITDGFRENCFWTMPVDIEKNHGYLDGSNIVLEGIKKNNHCTKSKYHIVGRVSPPDSSAFSAICDKFNELDSLNIRDFYRRPEE